MMSSTRAGSSSPGKTIGCIGKCTSGLSNEELDLITDHIHQTLIHPKGRKVFHKYLSQGKRKTDLACLDFYEYCVDIELREEQRSQSQSSSMSTSNALKNDLTLVMEKVEEMEDVPEFDLSLLERFNDVLSGQSTKESMLSLVEEVKGRLEFHLRQAHKGFRVFAKEPCPQSK